MDGPSFPQPVVEVVATLVDIFRHQGKNELSELIENAHAYFDAVEYDNWNGGTTTWLLRLEVPVPIFASIEQRLQDTEKEIGVKLTYLNRLNFNDPINGVTITPIAPGATKLGHRLTPSDVEIRRIGPENQFRLFLSHVSKYKIEVSKLKDELASRGVSAFVAHEDIEPSQEWQREIEVALRSMHALAALLTPDFHNSLWTDQEVGWALGRGVIVLPIRLGADPYGFFGKFQGVSGSLDNAITLANVIVDVLLVHQQTCREMRHGVVHALAEANSFGTAQLLAKKAVKFTDITDNERATLWESCKNNSQVSRAFGVVDSIYKAFGKPPEANSKKMQDKISF